MVAAWSLNSLMNQEYMSFLGLLFKFTSVAKCQCPLSQIQGGFNLAEFGLPLLTNGHPVFRHNHPVPVVQQAARSCFPLGHLDNTDWNMLYSETCLIRHALRGKFRVGKDRVSDYRVKNRKMVNRAWKSMSKNTGKQIRQVSDKSGFTVQVHV